MEHDDKNGHDKWWGGYGGMVDEDDLATMTTPAEVQALREYIEGRTSPEEAAKCLMDSDAWLTDWKDDRISWFIWDAAIEFPDRQPALLDLVDAIRELPYGKSQPGIILYPEKPKQWEGTELQTFDDVCSDTDNCKLITYRLKSPQLILRPYIVFWEIRYRLNRSHGPASSSWVAASTLAANLCVRTIDCSYQLHHCGFKIIRTTLEQDPWNHVPSA